MNRERIIELARECGVSTALYSGKWEVQGGPHQTKALESLYNQAKADALREAAEWWQKDSNYGNPAFVLRKMADEMEKGK